MDIYAELMAVDYRALQVYLHRNKGLGPKMWLSFLGFGFLISAILSVLQYSGLIIFHLPSALVAFFLAFVLNYVAFFRQSYQQQMRLMPSHTHPFCGRIHFSFNEKGIECKATGMSLSVEWQTITSFAQTNRHLFFFIDASTIIVFPKRCLPNEQALGDLQALLINHCPAIQAET